VLRLCESEMRMGKCVEAKCVPAKRLRRKDPKREYDGVGPFLGIDPNERYLCLGTGDERCQGGGEETENRTYGDQSKGGGSKERKREREREKGHTVWER